MVQERGVNASEVRREQSLSGHYRLDELQVIELVMAMEERFGITLPENELARVQTLGDLESLFENDG